jgi:hypothetical protein
VPDAFVVLWSRERLDRLKARGELGKPLHVLYGGPHSSAPSLARYGICAGDAVYVVGLRAGGLFLVARVRLGPVMGLADFLRQHLDVREDELALTLPALEQKLAQERPELGHAIPFGCVDEAALVVESTPAQLDLAIPLDVLQRVAFQTKRGETRPLPVDGGKVKRVASIQGHYLRLAPASVAALDQLLAHARE